MGKSFLKELKSRGLVKDISDEKKVENAQKNGKGLYCGFDPTAPSLHVGHLLPLTILRLASNFGIQPIALLGGGTGMIGDPSFKKKERVLLPQATVNANARSIEKQIKKIVPEVKLMNNSKWLSQFRLIKFLRDIGKDFNVAPLLRKDAINSRLDQGGLSVTEFFYPLLQAYDFYWLYDHEDCYIEVGGSDQWGNLTAGLDLIEKIVGKGSQAAGFTTPLLLQDNGEKFGKTADGRTVWLDDKLTSPYLFFQFWLSRTNEEAQRLFKSLNPQIGKKIVHKSLGEGDLPKKKLQVTLAETMTKLIHGEENCLKAQELTSVLFNKKLNFADWNPELQKLASEWLPKTIVKRRDLIMRALRASGITTSMRETWEFTRDKAISINGKLLDDHLSQRVDDFVNGNSKFALVKKGKRNYFLWEIK